MDLQLEGKTAVITGGTLGIGATIAEMLADEGVDVAICARNADRVAAMVEHLESKGVRAFGFPLDASDGVALKSFVDRAADALGGIDIVVANVSSLTHGKGEAEWKAAIEIDLMGAVRTCEAALPYLEKAAAEKGDASFLAISSMAATQVADGEPYGACKAALINYTKGMACANAARKVRFNTISPGTVFAEGGSWDRIKRASPKTYEMVLGLNPLGRMGKTEEIAATAVLLSSPLSGFTTGSNFVIDGGMSHRVNF